MKTMFFQLICFRSTLFWNNLYPWFDDFKFQCVFWNNEIWMSAVSQSPKITDLLQCLYISSELCDAPPFPLSVLFLLVYTDCNPIISNWIFLDSHDPSTIHTQWLIAPSCRGGHMSIPEMPETIHVHMFLVVFSNKWTRYLIGLF